MFQHEFQFANQDIQNLYSLLTENMNAGLKEVIKSVTSFMTAIPPATPTSQSKESSKRGPRLSSDPKRHLPVQLEMAVISF